VRHFLLITEREIAVARVLRSLGTGPLQRSQAEHAAQLLGVHWTTIYHLRARFLPDPRTSSLVADRGGRGAEPERLAARVEAVVTKVISQWVPAQRFLANPSWTPTWKGAAAATPWPSSLLFAFPSSAA